MKIKREHKDKNQNQDAEESKTAQHEHIRVTDIPVPPLGVVVSFCVCVCCSCSCLYFHSQVLSATFIAQCGNPSHNTQHNAQRTYNQHSDVSHVAPRLHGLGRDPHSPFRFVLSSTHYVILFDVRYEQQLF